MDTQSQKMKLLGNAPVSKALLAMGLPTMAGMLINALYNLADAYFVSGLGDIKMAAVSVVYPLGQTATGLGLLFGSGAASYISRLLGQKNKAQANKTASTALYLSLLSGAVFIAAVLCFMRPLLELLGAGSNIMPDALSYARVYMISCMFSIFNVTMNSIAASEGAAKTAMYALLSGAILNMVLDPLFIFTFRLGTAGAAAATAVSQLLSSVIYLIYIFSGKSLFHFKIKDCGICTAVLCEILKIGVPTLVFQLLTALSVSMTNHAAARFGESAVAAMGVVTRLLSVGSLSVFGFVKGFQPIAGYSFGAEKFDRLRSAIKTSVLWTTVFCTASGLLMSVFAEAIMSQFSSGNTQMMQTGTLALRAGGFTFIFFGFYTVYASLFLAIGRAKAGFILGICRQGLFFTPAVLVLPLCFGLHGVIYAQPAADLLCAAAAGFAAFSLHKKLTV